MKEQIAKQPLVFRNERIRAKEVRVIDEAGVQLGIMLLREALRIARERDLDLIEVATTTTPPVCRLLDYGKYKYEQAKKERKIRQGQKVGILKEIRLRPKISLHDLEAKTNMVGKLLKDGDKVKVSIIFRGREATHPELGWKALRKMVEALKEIATVESTPVAGGTPMALTFAPISTKRKRVEDKEGSLNAKAKNS